MRDCVECYTRDYVVVDYQYRHHSSSNWLRDRNCEKEALVQLVPPQEFEIDLEHSSCNGSSDDTSFKVQLICKDY